MRLWSLHPALLDRAGIVACWRESLLAQAVLAGRTRGYTRHPQLARFRAHPEPTVAIAAPITPSAGMGPQPKTKSTSSPRLATFATTIAQKVIATLLVPVR